MQLARFTAVFLIIGGLFAPAGARADSILDHLPVGCLPVSSPSELVLNLCAQESQQLGRDAVVVYVHNMGTQTRQFSMLITQADWVSVLPAPPAGTQPPSRVSLPDGSSAISWSGAVAPGFSNGVSLTLGQPASVGMYPIAASVQAPYPTGQAAEMNAKTTFQVVR